MGIAGSVLGGVGGLLGSHQEAAGYGNAQDFMSTLNKDASTAQGYADPFSQYRAGMASTLNSYLTGARSIQTDPGYQFAQSEGQQQVNRAAAAKGMGYSGNVMAALQQRGQDIASTQYGAIIDRLTNLAGAGSQNAIAGANVYGSMTGEALTGSANAAIGKAAANGRGIASLYSGFGQAMDAADAGGNMSGSGTGSSQGGSGQGLGGIVSMIGSLF